MNSRRFGRVWGLVLIGVLLVGVLPGFTQAQSNPPTYTGLDLLFLVDQSGSMGGADFGYPDREATDPLQLRFEAVQYVLDALGEYRLQIAPDLDFRMAVINFGDQPLVTLNWTPVAETAAIWATERDQILDQLSAATFGPANLGNTNFLAAFDLAQTLFGALPNDPDQPHLRVAILLTDGEPCVVSGPDAFDCGSPAGQQQHMDALKTLVQAAFPGPDYQVYVLALDATGELWQRRSADWQALVGEPERAVLVDTNQQVGVLFYKILAQLVAATGGDAVSGGLKDSQQLVPGRNTIFVPPYQRLMRLSLFKSSNSPGVLSVLQPNGAALPATDPSVTIINQDRPIEVWTIAMPIPGDWVFEVGSENDRIDVYLELIPIDVAVTATGGEFRQYADVPLAVQLTDMAAQTPLISYPAPYDLHVEAVLTLPDGTTEVRPLLSGTSGMYEGAFTANMSGVYTVGVRASITLPTGENYTIVNEPALSTITVYGLSLVVDDFPARQFLVGDETVVQARIVDDTGAVVSDPGLQLAGQLVNSLDTELSPVTFAGPDENGEFTAMLAFGGDLADDGDLYLHVVAHNQDGLLLGDSRTGPVAVLPSIMINLLVLEPQSGSEQYVTEGMPPLTSTDVEIVFETRLADDNSLVDVQPLAVDPATPVLQVTVVDAKKNSGTPVSLAAGDQPGQYRATVSDLPAGTYHVDVAAVGELRDRYIFNAQTRSVRVTIKRVNNPMRIVFYGALVAGGLLVAGLAALGMVRRARRKRHPARGVLVIARVNVVQNEKDEIWRVNLDRYNANTIDLNRRKLPRGIPITRLQVVCDNDRMSLQRQVRITAWKGREAIIQSRALTPGGMLTLHQRSGFDFNAPVEQEPVVYHLLKDPDDYGLGGSSGAMTF